MRHVLQVETRWGEDLIDLELVHARGSCRVAGVTVIRDGAIVVPRAGRVGLVDYAITRTPFAGRTIPFARGDDARLLPHALVVLAAHLLVWVLAVTSAPGDVDPPAPAKRPPRVVIRADAVAVEGTDPDEDPEAEEPAAESMMLPPGIAGGDRRPPAVGASDGYADPEMARTHDGDGEGARTDPAQAIESARTAGILGSTALTPGSLQALVGSDDLASGFDGASLDDGDGAAVDGFGTSRSDLGPGGGGDGWDTVPMKRTVAPPIRVGFLSIELCTRPHHEACTGLQARDRSIARRYIRRTGSALASCYQQHTRSAPAREVAVLINSWIARDGRARQLSGTWTDTEEPADCVARVLKKVRFARARGAVSIAIVYRRWH